MHRDSSLSNFFGQNGFTDSGALSETLILFSRTLALSLVGLMIFTTVWAQDSDRSFEIVTEDGVTVYGELYEPDNVKRPPVIMAFHQGGGDARGEYAPIIPRLLSEGYAVIAIDARRGGDRFEGDNRTLAGVGDAEYSYCDVLPDLEATLDYTRRQGLGRIIAWGSSYSATLVMHLAAKYPNAIDRIISFSPAAGEPMAGCQPREAASQLDIPALMIRPEREMELGNVAADMEAFRDMGHQTYVSESISHGSSVLVEQRAGMSPEATWTRVLEFLETK